MSRSRILPIVLLTSAAVLLFLYTFSQRENPASKEALAGLSANNAQFVRAKIAPKTYLNETALQWLEFVDATRLSTIFQQQAAERKSMFEAAVNKAHPGLLDVFLYIVPEVYCPLLVRVGSVEDGGKWECNPWALPKGGVVFSLGSRNDISFENDLQRITGRAASIVTVDMNPASKEALAGLSANNAQFVRAKIANKTDLNEDPLHYTVVDLMTNKSIVQIELLKMDIEGSETLVLPQFLASDSVCQIMVEIHAVEETPKLLRDVANAGFLLLKYEINPYGASTGVSEYSFIHEKCLAKYGASLLCSYLKQ